MVIFFPIFPTSPTFLQPPSRQHFSTLIHFVLDQNANMGQILLTRKLRTSFIYKRINIFFNIAPGSYGYIWTIIISTSPF